jgi:hypothetical protein
MATRDAARVLAWGKELGTIEPGKRADLLVIDNRAGDPYDALLLTGEKGIRLVMINGVARHGVPKLMTTLATNDQSISVGGQARELFLKQETADPDVAQVPLTDAVVTLRDALQNIAVFAKETEEASYKVPARALLDASTAPVWSLALDEICSCGVEMAPRLPFGGPQDFTGPERAPLAVAGTAQPLSEVLKPIRLDPLTVADDDKFLDMITKQPNVPGTIKNDLSKFY